MRSLLTSLRSWCLRPSGRSSVLRHGWERSFYEFAAILLAEGVISGKEIPSGSTGCGSSQGRITSPGLSSPR